jgi:FkbM family methyltransferase
VNRVVKLSKILRTAPYRRAFLRHGVAAAVEHAEALSALPLRTVVDIGANRGQFALFALRTFPDAQVTSLEPLAGPADKFRRVFAGERRVTLRQSAVGPTRTEATMHVSGHDDSSSLLPITATQDELFRGTGEVRTETVPVAPLSELLDADRIEAPALLKLDVQGYELQALQACESILDRFTYVCAEGSFIELYEGQVLVEELVGWLERAGYALVTEYGGYRDASGRRIQTDMLFKRRS